MAQVFFDSDTPTIHDLNLTAQDVLSKHVPIEQLPDYELFMNARKVGRDQKLCDVKGVKVLRILNRKTSRVPPPANLREEVVKLDERIKEFGMFEDRKMLHYLYNNDIIKNLISNHPIILEEPILLNVLTDYSLMCAMLHEEHGFIQQHPSYVTILQKILADVIPDAPNEFLNRIRHTFNPRPQRDENNAGPAAAGRVPFTAQMLQNALSNSFAQHNPQQSHAAADGVSHPAVEASLAAQPHEDAADEPMPDVQSGTASNNATRYATQLEQLHNLGFFNDEENILILDSVNGNVEDATNLLFEMRE